MPGWGGQPPPQPWRSAVLRPLTGGWAIRKTFDSDDCKRKGKQMANDVVMLAAALGFAVLSWLLIVLCDRLMGDKP
jgi:hypothetical protein